MEVADMATKKVIEKVKYYVLDKPIPEGEKCPPQSRLIVETVQKAGGKITRDELLRLLRRPVEEGGMKATQPIERVLGFYRPRLKEAGILHEVEESHETEVEVPDEPAKAEGAAAGAEGTAAGAEGAPTPAAQEKKKKESKEPKPAKGEQKVA
jgi:hypothetical protein